MEKQFKKLLDQFIADCKKEGVDPLTRIVIKPEIQDSLNLRERNFVDIIVSTYLTANIYFNPLKDGADVCPKDTKKHKKCS